MPTAAKLFAFLAFAAVAFFAANGVPKLLPEGTALNLFIPISTMVGALSGWFISGRLVGKGFMVAMGTGMRTSLTLLFWCLVIFATDRMLNKSVQLAYDGPVEAVTSIFEIGLEYFLMVMVPDIIGILLVGGALAGAFVEWASRRWR